MSNYLHNVSFSKLPKDYVQKLLLNYIINTQPNKLRFNPTIIEYSDTKILFGMQKHYGRLSLSVDIFLKNINPSLATDGIKMINESYRNDFLKLKVGKIEYVDTDIMKVNFYNIIIRIDSIIKLIPGGLKEFLKYKNVYGATNGRLLIMMEMQSFPRVINDLYTEILKPNGFKDKLDFVHGYSSLYEKEDNGKPIEWCIVPWLQSIITPFGFFVKFKNPES